MYKKYHGNRCFMVGNGPSLKSTPLDLLCGEYSFAMNRINLIFEQTRWRPTFYVAVTSSFDDQKFAADMQKAMKESQLIFAWDKYKSYVTGDYVPLKVSHTKHYEAEQAQDDWWSDDIQKRVCKFGTSMLAALQIAVYLGFDPIYLVGVDGKYYDDPSKNHFTESYSKKLTDERNHPTNGGLMTKAHHAAHRIAKHAADRLGVYIYDATIGGSLEIYPKMNLYEIVGVNDV